MSSSFSYTQIFNLSTEALYELLYPLILIKEAYNFIYLQHNSEFPLS